MRPPAIRLVCLATTITAVLLASSRADTLELRDGSLVQGEFAGGSQSSIRFRVGDEVVVYPLADVLSLTFTEGEASRAAAPEPTAQAAPAPDARAAGGPVVVPAGARLLLRMDEALSSRTHKAGHKFTASLEADLAVGGVVVAPIGTKVYGKLAATKRAKRLAGQSELTVRFTDIMIDGQLVPIKTTQVKAVSEETGRDSTGKVARGGAVGALADGGDKAATGSQAGAGLAILTRGAEINVPAGTLLEARLKQDLSH